eukprot:TRINITY_DN9007_c0_g1_i1.p1 TRINITY_DN9007_c0_g1~~TRINITY_DN9007_c0_g1_i1.p1  ORF type:complete len:290 (-),score=57.22 TRINITY_DN9007_c0_g1_i1:98-967(-)
MELRWMTFLVYGSTRSMDSNAVTSIGKMVGFSGLKKFTPRVVAGKHCDLVVFGNGVTKSRNQHKLVYDEVEITLVVCRYVDLEALYEGNEREVRKEIQRLAIVDAALGMTLGELDEQVAEFLASEAAGANRRNILKEALNSIRSWRRRQEEFADRFRLDFEMLVRTLSVTVLRTKDLITLLQENRPTSVLKRYAAAVDESLEELINKRSPQFQRKLLHRANEFDKKKIAVLMRYSVDLVTTLSVLKESLELLSTLEFPRCQCEDLLLLSQTIEDSQLEGTKLWNSLLVS